MATAEIKAVITADDQASGVLANFGKSIAGIGIPLAAVGGAITAFGVLAVNSFNDSQLVGAQLNSVLKSTAGVAGVTADEVNRLSSALQKTTRYSDEQIGSAQNMLLTFTNISKNVFPDTTKVVLDMATAMGTDLTSTAIQVGKAMQDPTQGASALQRVGVRLTESQKDLVKSLQDTGDMAGAQAIILKELQTEFGGSAEAAGKTFAGQLDIARNALDDIMESIGKVIAEGLAPFVEKIKPAVEAIQIWITKNPELTRTIVLVAGAVGVAALALGGLAIAIGIVETVGAPLIAIGLGIVAALAGVGFIAKLVIDKMGGLQNVLATIEPYVKAVQDTFSQMYQIFTNQILPVLAQIYDAIFNKLISAFQELFIAAGINAESFKGLAIVIGGVLLSGVVGVTVAFSLLSGIVIGLVEAQTALLNIMMPNRSAMEANAEGLKRVEDSTRLAMEAIDNTTRAMDGQRDAADKLRGANLSLEGANLAVESAQIRYNDAVLKYGAPSLEARSAAYNLKTAQERQKDAANDAAKATDNSKTANQNLANAVPQQIKAIDNMTGVFDRQRQVLSELGNYGQNYLNKLSGISNQTNFLKQAGGSSSIFPLRASGGPVNSGTTYIVGEQGPELFSPNSNGNIIPNNQIANSSGSSSTTININIGLMTGSAIERREAASRMFEDLKDIAGQRGQTVGQMIGA